MATHSSVLAWRIPGRGSLVGCCLWGRTESDTTEAMQQQQQQEYLEKPVWLVCIHCVPRVHMQGLEKFLVIL